LFSIRRRPAHFDSKRLLDQAFEGRGMAVRGPQLELGVALGAELEQRVVAAVVQLDAADRLGVAAIEAFGEAQDGRERANGPAPLLGEVADHRMFLLGRGAAMVTGDQGDGFDFVGLEAAQVAVANQVLRVDVVPLVADMDADIVEDRRVLEPLALAVGEAVNRARLIEQRR
jgi:hypothetical protein